MERRIFPDGQDGEEGDRGRRPYADFRWSRFRNFPPAKMYEVIGNHGFPWRHIIELMVELTAPVPDDVICDPAAGTCGFLHQDDGGISRLLHDRWQES